MIAARTAVPLTSIASQRSARKSFARETCQSKACFGSGVSSRKAYPTASSALRNSGPSVLSRRCSQGKARSTIAASLADRRQWARRIACRAGRSRFSTSSICLSVLVVKLEYRRRVGLGAARLGRLDRLGRAANPRLLGRGKDESGVRPRAHNRVDRDGLGRVQALRLMPSGDERGGGLDKLSRIHGTLGSGRSGRSPGAKRIDCDNDGRLIFRAPIALRSIACQATSARRRASSSMRSTMAPIGMAFANSFRHQHSAADPARPDPARGNPPPDCRLG